MSVTNMAEYQAPELIQRHFPHRFEERTPQGRLGRKATWDRLTFHTWRPRRVWRSGQARLTFGEPVWEHLPEDDVTALIGEEERHALPPPVPAEEDPA